jgi:hypothetical protein
MSLVSLRNMKTGKRPVFPHRLMPGRADFGRFISTKRGSGSGLK